MPRQRSATPRLPGSHRRIGLPGYRSLVTRSFYRGNQLITAFGYGGDETGLLGTVAERLAQLDHGAGHGVVSDQTAAPHRLFKIGARHHLTRAGGKIDQGVHHPGLETHLGLAIDEQIFLGPYPPFADREVALVLNCHRAPPHARRNGTR
jgi:hypothetical protein